MRSVAVNFQSKGLAVALKRVSKALSRVSIWATSWKSLGEKTLRWTMEKTTSTWLSHEACTGVCTSTQTSSGGW